MKSFLHLKNKMMRGMTNKMIHLLFTACKWKFLWEHICYIMHMYMDTYIYRKLSPPNQVPMLSLWLTSLSKTLFPFLSCQLLLLYIKNDIIVYTTNNYSVYTGVNFPMKSFSSGLKTTRWSADMITLWMRKLGIWEAKMTQLWRNRREMLKTT